MDLTFRLPEEFRGLEPDCRDAAGGVIRRGKIDCTLRLATAEGAAEPLELDEAALESLKVLQSKVRSVLPEARALAVGEVLRWAGVVRESRHDVAALAEAAKRCFGDTLAALQEARQREGERIAALLEQRNADIVALLDSIKPLLDEMQARYRGKLVQRLERLDVQVQPERLEQEVALIAQRFDIAEEVDRLGSHVAEIRHVLARDEPIGRRLDFLAQELNREANTLSAKAQDDELTRVAVDLKVLIEQMREQVQNLE